MTITNEDITVMENCVRELAAKLSRQPCGHPQAAMHSSDEGIHYCAWCADVEAARAAEREQCAQVAEATHTSGPFIDSVGLYYNRISEIDRGTIAKAIRARGEQ